MERREKKKQTCSENVFCGFLLSKDGQQLYWRQGIAARGDIGGPTGFPKA